MLIQPLLDKLVQLRLPAFRDGLQEQLGNPKYAELAFEERLALLVDRECTGRHDRRTQRRIKLANFPQPASIEDLDLSPSRGLDRHFVLELAQCLWIASHLNTLALAQLEVEKPTSPAASDWLRAATIILSTISAPRVCSTNWLNPTRMVLILLCSPAWPNSTC
jgi:hypothetical protein